MTTTRTTETLAALRAAFPECTVRRGWHLDGVGPARYGWGATYPSGKVRYLGPTLAAAQKVLDAEVQP